jgi:hypothetical protein
MKWSEAEGVVINGIEIRSDDTGHGMYATKDLAENEMVLTIDSTLVPTLRKARESLIGQYLAQNFEVVQSNLLEWELNVHVLVSRSTIFCFLCDMRFNPTERGSLLADYVKSLPATYNTPFFGEREGSQRDTDCIAKQR